MKVVYKHSAPIKKTTPKRRIDIVIGGLISVIIVIWVFSSAQVLGTKTSKQTEDGSTFLIESTQILTSSGQPSQNVITYPNESPQGYSGFFEEFTTIDGQLVYIAIPQTINPQNKPEVVAYYHGSMRPVVDDFSNEWMQQIRKLAAATVANNKIFVASNQHDDNFGDPVAVTDTIAAINWVNRTYPSKTDTYTVVGFSMGGLGALRHTIMYASEVRLLVLIAPANHLERYTVEEKTQLARVPAAIWHSTNDLNVDSTFSEQLRDAINAAGGSWRLTLLSGDDHVGTLVNHVNDIARYIAK